MIKRSHRSTASTTIAIKLLLTARTLLDKRRYIASFTLLMALLAVSLSGTDRHVGAQGTFPDPNANCPRATCGEVSPFIPMQSAEAVHMGLVWKRNSSTPKILFHAPSPGGGGPYAAIGNAPQLKNVSQDAQRFVFAAQASTGTDAER